MFGSNLRRAIALVGAIGICAVAAVAGTAEAGTTDLHARVGTTSTFGPSEHVAARANGSCPAGTVKISRLAISGQRGNECVYLVGSNQYYGVNNDLGAIATEVIRFFADKAGVRVNNTSARVICWSPQEADALARGALGWVYMPKSVINLHGGVCDILYDIYYEGLLTIDYQWAEAVDTLAHEAMHVAGVENEALAECFAMQLTQFTAEQLGRTGEEGFALGSEMWGGYVQYGQSNPEYFTADCYDGGPLDLYPEDVNIWP